MDEPRPVIAGGDLTADGLSVAIAPHRPVDVAHLYRECPRPGSESQSLEPDRGGGPTDEGPLPGLNASGRTSRSAG